MSKRRLTQKREQQIQEFGTGGEYLRCSRTTLQIAYSYHVADLRAEIAALRQERDEARAARLAAESLISALEATLQREIADKKEMLKELGEAERKRDEALWLLAQSLPVPPVGYGVQAPLQWSCEPPTEPGWYWWRDSASSSTLFVVRIARGISGLVLMALIGSSQTVIASEQKGQWAGPLVPPGEAEDA